jgi:hypothetical protein
MSGPAFYTGTINIAKNEDWVVSFTYQTNDAVPVPIDLTGSQLELQVRQRETDHTAVVATSSPQNGIVLDSASGGQFTIKILNAETANVAAPSSIRLIAGQDYVADLIRLKPDGEIERIFEAAVSVAEGTTR